jgi:hypothetical protein
MSRLISLKGTKAMRQWIGVAVAAMMMYGAAALGDIPGVSPNQNTNVQNKLGDASPAPTNPAVPLDRQFSNGEQSSRIDDYFNQDDQINLTENSGVVKVLRVNQKVLVNDYVTEVIPLKNPNAVGMAREIRGAFRTITNIEGGTAEVIRNLVTKEAAIQVVCPKFQLPFIRQAVEALDEPWIKDGQDGFDAKFYRAKYRSVADVNSIAAIWTDGEGVSVVDTTRNSVLRRDEPFRVSYFLDCCKQVDVVPSQMMAECAIYEINTQNDQKLGLDYIAWKNGPGRNLFELVIGGVRSGQEVENMSSLWSPYQQRVPMDGDLTASVCQMFFSGNILLTAAYVDSLASKGKARVLARPKIVARSGQPATFTATDQFLAFVVAPNQFNRTPIPTPAAGKPATDVGVDNRTLNHNIAPLSAGISLVITPNIGKESSEVTVSATYQTLAGMTPQGTPIVSSRSITTRARVVDGQPLILSGLNRNEKVDSYAGMPWISRIPLLGLLFGGETHSNRGTEVVIVLTPKITLGTDCDQMTVEEDLKTMDLATGKTEAKLPESPWGFDQWLLDKSD